MRTVRSRITLLSTLIAVLVLVAAALALVAVLESQLTEQSDGALRARASELADTAASGELAADLRPVTDEGLVQVVGADGRVLAASANLLGGAPVGQPSVDAESLSVDTLEAPDDDETERYRVWRVSRETPDGVVTVFVGTSLESVDEATATLRTALYVGVPLMLVLLAVGTWYVVGRALGRVERVRREVARLGDGDLSRRLDAGPPDEVGRLVTTLNAMLGRLEDSQRRQRAFVADASHELQSPVTAFRTQLEVARAHPAGHDWPRLVDDLLDDTDRMQALVSDLLLLEVSASAEHVRTRVDLHDLVEAELARVTADGVTRTLRSESPAVVVGDEAQLARVARNLLENAVRHAGSRVDVVVGADAVRCWVRVTDDGPGVPVEDAERVFDRFHRGDPARSRHARGSGLGLAIARAIARAHGGEVVLTGGPPGATFELTLPTRQPS